MKITHATCFRTNFELDGLHYSISSSDDYYESCCNMRCKETGAYYYMGFGTSYFDVISTFIKTNKYGATYSQRYDLEKLEQFAREIISGKEYKDTEAYKWNLEQRRLNEIKYHLRMLEKLGYNI